MDVDRLMREEAAAWAELQQSLERVPDDRFEEPGVTPEGWSPKDVVYHVAGWLEDCAAVLSRVADGTFDRRREPDDRATIDDINRTWFERSRTVSAADAREALALGRARAARAFGELESVTPEAWEWFEESGPLHYAAHARDLDAWLVGGRP